MIIVYGGSFDPPHLGHVRVLQDARAAYPDARIDVVPAFKSMEKDFPVGGRHRLLLCDLAFGGIAKVDNIELFVNRPVSCAELIRYYHSRHSDHELMFLVGSDCAASLRTWQEPMWLESNPRLKFLVHERGGYDASASGFKNIVALAGESIGFSSTAIRERISAGEDVSAMLQPKVLSHIEAHGLYGAKKKVGKP